MGYEVEKIGEKKTNSSRLNYEDMKQMASSAYTCATNTINSVFTAPCSGSSHQVNTSAAGL